MFCQILRRPKLVEVWTGHLPASPEQCGNAWLSRVVNRILLDEERMVQFPAIICCLTCKCMLRQRGTAALSCAAVRFQGWKLQGMLFPGWAAASEGSSMDLIFQAAFVRENCADCPSNPAIQHKVSTPQHLHQRAAPTHRCEYFRCHQLQHIPARWNCLNTGSQRELINITSGSPLVNAILLQLSPWQGAAGMLPPAPGQELGLCCTAILLETPIFDRKGFASRSCCCLSAWWQWWWVPSFPVQLCGT